MRNRLPYPEFRKIDDNLARRQTQDFSTAAANDFRNRARTDNYAAGLTDSCAFTETKKSATPTKAGLVKDMDPAIILYKTLSHNSFRARTAEKQMPLSVLNDKAGTASHWEKCLPAVTAGWELDRSVHSIRF